MRMNRNRETMSAIEKKNAISEAKEKTGKIARGLYALGMAASTFCGATAMAGMTAFAAGSGGDSGTSGLGKLTDTMTKVAKVVGGGLIIYGIYEIVMSVLQQAAEQKTKGLVMIAVGAVMETLSFAL